MISTNGLSYPRTQQHCALSVGVPRCHLSFLSVSGVLTAPQESHERLHP